MNPTSYQEEWDDPNAEAAAAAFAAQLTEVAYGVALRHGVRGSFADLELALWSELRRAVATYRAQTLPARSAA